MSSRRNSIIANPLMDLKDINYFEKPINIKEHINNLSFIEEDKRKIYGLYFQGGICKINKQSYDYIINNTSKN